MLASTMMDSQLTIPSILERAIRLFPDTEIVSVMPAGVNPETNAPIPRVHRTTYAQTHPRVMQLCNALVAAGVVFLALVGIGLSLGAHHSGRVPRGESAGASRLMRPKKTRTG